MPFVAEVDSVNTPPTFPDALVPLILPKLFGLPVPEVYPCKLIAPPTPVAADVRSLILSVGLVPCMSKIVAGAECPIPTLSLPPSTNSILALPFDSTLKSVSTEPSLNTVSSEAADPIFIELVEVICNTPLFCTPLAVSL